MREMKLLIVDDNAAMRRMLRRLLGDHAGVTLECDDGAQAVEIYTRHRPDWVLMDIEMKGLDGLEATSQIRAIDPDARIVIVTNFEDASLRTAAAKAGACGYVLKDNLIELRALLVEGLQRP